MRKAICKEILLILLAITITFIFSPLQKIADSLFTLSWGLTVNEWIGTGLLIFVIWVIIRCLTRINEASDKNQIELISGFIQQQSVQIKLYNEELVKNMPSKEDIIKLATAIDRLTEKLDNLSDRK